MARQRASHQRGRLQGWARSARLRGEPARTETKSATITTFNSCLHSLGFGSTSKRLPFCDKDILGKLFRKADSDCVRAQQALKRHGTERMRTVGLSSDPELSPRILRVPLQEASQEVHQVLRCPVVACTAT